MPISIASRKAKARELQKWVCKKASELTDIEWGKDKMIASREMGQSGTDVRLIGEAREKFPWSVECKRQEKWSIHDWIKQAEDNKMKNTDWIVVARKSRKKAVVILDAEVFFDILDRIEDDVKGRLP